MGGVEWLACPSRGRGLGDVLAAEDKARRELVEATAMAEVVSGLEEVNGVLRGNSMSGGRRTEVDAGDAW